MATDVIAPGGGPAGYTFNLLRGFQALGARASSAFTVQAIASEGAERHRTLGAGSRSRRGLGQGFIEAQPFSSLNALASCIKWLLSSSDRVRRKAYAHADIVVFHGYQSSRRAAWARRHGRRVVYMPHSPTVMADEYRMLERARGARVSRSRYRFLARDEERLIRLADFVVFPSPNAAEGYEDCFKGALKSAHRRFIASGVPPQKVSTAPSGPEPLVLFVGRYVAHKGYDLFLDAAELLRDRDVRARFTTLGAGDRFRTSPAVVDVGWSDDPAAEIGRADVVVVPNRVAYFDLLPLEVASQGKALVMTRVGGNLDQLAAFPDSMGAEPTALSIADAIESALARRRELPSYGAANAVAFAERFTVDEMARQWSEFFDDLVAHPTR